MKPYAAWIILYRATAAPPPTSALACSGESRRSTLRSWGGGGEIGWVKERRVNDGLAEVTIGRGDTAEDLTISIPDTNDDATALSTSLWPSALAGSILLRSPELRSALSDRRVLELGSGLGLAGLVAANAPAKQCILTDKDDDAVAALSGTASRNEVNECEMLAQKLDWRDSDGVVDVPSDIVLGTDLAYYFFLLRPLMDAARSNLSPDDGLLYVVGQANRESQWDLFHNINDGCYNQVTDEREPPWPGLAKMLLYDLSIGPWKGGDSKDNGDDSTNEEIPIAVLTHFGEPDRMSSFLTATDHVATEMDEQNQMHSF